MIYWISRFLKEKLCLSPESLAYPIKFGGKASKTSEFYRKSNAFTLPKKQLLKRVVLEVKAIALWLI